MSEQPGKAKKQRLTVDELIDQFHQVAQDEDAGPDRFRAGKLLLSMQTSTTVLPEPLTEDELLDRVGRILKGVGPDLSRLAFRRAFPHLLGAAIDITAPLEISVDNEGLLTPEQREFCHRASASTRMLYKLFPELKAPGRPAGILNVDGPIRRRAHRYRIAVKAMVDRVNNQTKAPLEIVDAPDPTITG